MVHFPPLPSRTYVFSTGYSGINQSGFPHSEIPGSKPACGSPRLIAACHVLHRLLAPRHPPYALSSLTIKLTQHVAFPAQETRNETSGVEQARLSTICSARAEFADFVSRPGFVRIPAAIQNASLFSCQRSLCPQLLDRPTPGGTFTPSNKRQNNKKPGVERRANPSRNTRTGSRDARLICYPEFVIDLTDDRSNECSERP